MSNESNPHSFTTNKPVDPSTIRVLRALVPVVADLDCPFFVAGTTARDLVLVNVYGLSPGRATRDIDFGIAVLIDLSAYDQAAQIASINRLIREASGYPRGPAELGFIKASFDLQPSRSVPKVQPMSLVALSRWIVEELEALK